ncbi:glycoside hydrolase family 71 protein [Actinomadura parmotrematis]|uniref:glycoside hydrolase family 71 protein n=1 Tax=Actinomadura parmotrematis TaxID=2864039 RepID=UPI0027E393EA|nr:glycoside hydrolase family 71 protein [Actinomadura parmotrematis]
MLLTALAGILAVGLVAAWLSRPVPTVTAAKSGATAAAAASPLPFDLPSTATLRASGKLVFAHYFTPYPRSLDNKDASADYYTRNYLNPAGEGGIHAAYGGLLRDRPAARAPLTGDYQLADMEYEVRTAIAAGLDGFTVDLLNLDPSSAHRKRVDLLIKAAQAVDPGFKIVLMPDMTATQIKAYTPAGLAAALAGLAASPNVYRLADGRLVLSPFKAENQTADWYTQLTTALSSTYGIKTALVPVFLNFGANYAKYSAISYGFSNWGNRSPNLQGGVAGNVSTSHTAGKIWMQPVAVQDERPDQKIYDEAGNTENLRTTWQNAISAGTDWVQLTTWNDFSEGTQFAPSPHNGGAYLDLASYYLTRLKTGAWPAIVRDTAYVSHRTQLAATKPTAGGQTAFMVPRSGTTTPRDTVEVLSFLKAAATVRATVGGTATDYAAAAGVQAKLFPLAFGANGAAIVRSGTTVASVASPFTVTATPTVQDLQYSIVSSGRG